MKVHIVLLVGFLIGCSNAEEKCSISYEHSARFFQPFILDSEGSFLTPNYEGKINVPHGDSVIFACMQFTIEGREDSSVEFTCVNGELTTDKKGIQYSDIQCQLRVIDLYSSISPDSCRNHLVLYQFEDKEGYGTSKDNIVGETCYNPSRSIPIYSHYKVSSPPKFVDNHPDASVGLFLSTVDVLSTYRSDKLNKKITDILGSKDKVNDTLRSVPLIPKELVHPQLADVSRRAHNLVGMWESIQLGNWENLINDIKSINRKSREFDIYTGTYGVLALPNVDNKLKELYLQSKKGEGSYPVPGYIWSVVYEATTQKSVVIVLANNVIHQENVRELSLCANSVCEEIDWIKNLKKNDNYENFNLGQVSCCDLNTFRSIVTDIPAIDKLRVNEGSEGLLKN